MDWRQKARTQKALCALPAGHRLNYLMQRHVTRTLPRDDRTISEIVDTARQHLDALRQHSASLGELESLRFFEFGAGYDLLEPLACYGFGVRHQILFDMRPVARPAMVRDAVGRLRSVGLDLPPLAASSDVEGYLAKLGISYVAPADARATGLAENSVDVVKTTSVLEHVPPRDVSLIMDEMRRILKPGGVCSFAIDYHDHFAGTDDSISGFNFLRFTDEEWARWNSDLQYQNRLRHEDYVEIFERAGLELTSIDAIVDERFPADPVLSAKFEGRGDLEIGDGWFLMTNP